MRGHSAAEWVCRRGLRNGSSILHCYGAAVPHIAVGGEVYICLNALSFTLQ